MGFPTCVLRKALDLNGKRVHSAEVADWAVALAAAGAPSDKDGIKQATLPVNHAV